MNRFEISMSHPKYVALAVSLSSFLEFGGVELDFQDTHLRSFDILFSSFRDWMSL